jgi:predicted nucleotidyltransferase
MALDLFGEFTRVIAALDHAGVDHAVVGALAVAIHGAPRATTDIDLLVERESLPRALEVARECGFDLAALPMKFHDGTEVHRVTKIDGTDAVTLDYLVVDETLAPVFASRMRVETDFGSVRVVSREALIRMKAAAGRPRDLGDIASLEEMDR